MIDGFSHMPSLLLKEELVKTGGLVLIDRSSNDRQDLLCFSRVYFSKTVNVYTTLPLFLFCNGGWPARKNTTMRKGLRAVFETKALQKFD